MADYLESVRRAGGEPFELDAARDTAADGRSACERPDADRRRRRRSRRCTAKAPHPTFQPSEEGRDAYEIGLIKAAIDAGLPIFAICRGMQILNVALGGTLVQDIPSMVNGAAHHSVPDPRYHIAHEVWVARGSRLAAIMGDKLEGETCQVNSRHHQAVKTVAAGWEVSGTAPDGVIEAIEQPGQAFRLAVQWHPENFWRTGEFRPLFEGFIEAARSVTR